MEGTNWTDYFMPIGIGIIMFGIGLNLSFRDFSRVFSRPKVVGLGLLAQLVLLPALAFGLIFFWKVDPMLKALEAAGKYLGRNPNKKVVLEKQKHAAL